jgi:hypothetical protein
MYKELIMLKALSLLAAITFCLFTSSNVFAVDYSQGDIGTAEANIVTIVTAGVADADNIRFQASAQVRMSGHSVATAFAHGAYHTQVEGKKNGRQFGMASDSSSTFWLDIEPDGSVVTVDFTQSANFTGDWVKM